MDVYIARLICAGEVRQALEFEAEDDAAAWEIANDGIEPVVHGCWVEVQRKPDPQGRLDL